MKTKEQNGCSVVRSHAKVIGKIAVGLCLIIVALLLVRLQGVAAEQTETRAFIGTGVSMATCNHKYEWVTTKEPTCTTAGKSEYKCSICGNVRDGREIAFLGHNMKEKSRVDSTCTKQGTITYECTRCKTTTKESIALKSHSYSWVTTKEPTCTEGGKSEKICSVCGRVADGKEIASLGGHDWVLKKTVDSTCAEKGTKTYKCSKCSETKTESIAKKEHNYSWKTTKEPTCTAGGKSEKVCSGCGRVADGQEIPALGHDPKYQSMVDSTCAKTGTKYYKCSRCTYTSTETIPLKAHTYSWVETKQPTCTEGGKKENKCTGCGRVIDGVDIPFLGHNDVFQSKVDSTCAKTGTETYRCSRCGNISTKTIPVKEHTYSWVETKKPTCTEGGKKENKCTGCGRVIDGVDIPFLGHNDVFQSKVDSTCAKTGTETYRCSRCGNISTKTIPVKEHTYSWKTTKEPTCTEGGKSEKICSGCGRSVDGKEIAALGHDPKLQSKVDSTCAKTGTETYKCSRCDNISTKTIALKDHTYSWKTTKEPTCTEGGKSEKICSGCGRSVDGKEIAALGHDPKLQSKVDSTCAKTGTETYKCSRCDNISTKTIPLKAHTYSWVETKKATCTEGGKKEKKCSVCRRVDDGVETPALGHDPQLKSKVDSTCSKVGTETYKCSRCDNISTKTIPLKEHIYSWKTVLEPGCTTPGKSEYKCDKCGHASDGKEIAPLGHRNCKWTTVTKPTKTSVGKENYVCGYCKGVVKSRALYLISYDAHGGTNAPASQIKSEGVAVTLSTAVPTRSKYVFVGWGTTTNAATGYVAGYSFKEDKNVTFYAVWKPADCTVTYNLNGGTGKVPATIKVSYDTTVVIPEASISREGYWFLGWATSKSAPEPQYTSKKGQLTVKDNTTLYAVWKAKNVYINYDYNDGSGTVVSVKHQYGEKVAVGHILKREGYNFRGWAKSKTATEKDYISTSIIEMGAENITLYAVWEVKNYTLSFNLNGGTGKLPAKVTASYGTEIPIKQCTTVTRTGYYFTGWATTPNSYSARYQGGTTLTLTENTTLYAIWKVKKTCTITFDLNGGYAGIVDPITVATGTVATIPLAKAKRCGYYFLGWSESKTATKETYRSGGVRLEDDLKLYAVWSICKDGSAGHTFTSYEGYPDGFETGTEYHNDYCVQCKKKVKVPHTMKLVHFTDLGNGVGIHGYACVDADGRRCGYVDGSTFERCDKRATGWRYYKEVIWDAEELVFHRYEYKEATCPVCATTCSFMIESGPLSPKGDKITYSDIVGLIHFFEDIPIFDQAIDIFAQKLDANEEIKDTEKTIVLNKVLEANEEAIKNGVPLQSSGKKRVDVADPDNDYILQDFASAKASMYVEKYIPTSPSRCYELGYTPILERK